MAQGADQGFSVKIAMLGESGVGKTCIIDRFVNDVFNDYTDPTKGASFRAKGIKSLDGTVEIKLMLWDTAGQEIYRSLAPFYYKDADVAILVYDITNDKSYEALQYWSNEVKQNGKPECLLTIVGNKCDCIDNEKVSPTVAKEFAKTLNGSFFLSSAKENSNIRELFIDLAMRKYPNMRSKFGFEEAKHEVDSQIPSAQEKAATKAKQAEASPDKKDQAGFKLAPAEKTQSNKKKGCC